MISFRKEVERIAPKGTAQLMFKNDGGTLLHWKNGKIYVGGKIGTNRPLGFGWAFEVTDVELESYERLELIGCEVNGVIFKREENDLVLNWDYRAGEDDPDDEGLLDYLLFWWPTSTPRFAPSQLKCEITHHRVLHNLVMAYTEHRAGYFTTLQKMTEYTVESDCPIHVFDEAFDLLKEVKRENEKVGLS